MLIKNEEVLRYCTTPAGNLIHLIGESDTGRTQTVFSILDSATRQDQVCTYWIPRKEEFRRNVFNEMLAYPEHCFVGFPRQAEDFAIFLNLVDGVDLVCIDNFLEYIIHKSQHRIRATFSMISAAAYKFKTNFVLVNDLRYYEAKGGEHPAYGEYFRHFCARHVRVYKDSDFNISYTFSEP